MKQELQRLKPRTRAIFFMTQVAALVEKEDVSKTHAIRVLAYKYGITIDTGWKYSRYVNELNKNN